MSSTPKNDKNVSDTETPKPRGGKLARRARSFKEDFLEIISQMRSPGSQRSQSPHSPRSRSKPNSVDVPDSTEKMPLKDLDGLVRQVQFALKHFHDVVNKKKLEMVPGNGTIVLETVISIHMLLKNYMLNEQSSVLVSATNQVYQSLANLIKWSDNILLHGDKTLNKENVTDVLNAVEDAVKNLVELAQDKIANKENINKGNQNFAYPDRTSQYSAVSRNSDLFQRNSLPDIPLTPREMEILKQTSVDNNRHVVHSQSSESILNHDSTDQGSPPPKPPLPGRSWVMNDSANDEAPPLPPKRRPKIQKQGSLSQTSGEQDDVNSTPQHPSISQVSVNNDLLSVRSKSPDSSSLLSASAGSLDSVLNQSREDVGQSGVGSFWDSSSSTSTECRNDSKNSSVVLGQDFSLLDAPSSPFLITEFHGPNSPKLDGFGLLRDDVHDNIWNGVDKLALDINSVSETLGKLAMKDEQLSMSQSESGFSSLQSLRSSSQSYTSQNFSSVSRSSQQSMSYSESSTKSSHSESSTKQMQKSKYSQKLTSEVKTSSLSSYMHAESSNVALKKMLNDSEVSGCDFSASEHDCCDGSSSPPALPQKTKTRRKRFPSQYDNIPDMVAQEFGQQSTSANIHPVHQLTCSLHSQSFQSYHASCRSPDGKPPPLPPKKRHIMAYMEIFGNCSQPNINEFLRHSVHSYNWLQAEWQQKHEMTLSSTHSCSFSLSSASQMLSSSSLMDSTIETPPQTPPKEKTVVPPALPPKCIRTSSVKSSSSTPPVSPHAVPHEVQQVKTNCVEIEPVKLREEEVPETKPVELVKPVPPVHPKKSESDTDFDELNPLDELDVTHYLVYKKSEEEGPDIRGGNLEALIVHATRANKNDFLYQEAFLTTYRTFISPLDLIFKLIYRYERFGCAADHVRQRAARNAFSLLVRVVDDLTISDLQDKLLQTLMDFVYQLVCSGDLTLAKALRVKILEKCNSKKFSTPNPLLPSLNVYTRQPSLVDFKSEQIAEQMTLLDANLFMKIEIPEVLIWAQEQNEERSPNLTRFTEHFNKMSYWARSRILEQGDAKDRERYVVKFIKIMKHLRKINNFNSYLALLSALDSAPIRRLEWQKQITEGLKEYCALIDSSSSFRAYRQALADTQPPCIPYIGLVLQDLTFVHIGNSDLLQDGAVNFSKRWQQFNIVENMKRFKKCQYTFKKNERIIAFFNNFDDFLCEEAMWQISESIKPRGGKKNQA